MSGLITRGYGKNNLIITRGLGAVFKVEIREIPPSAGAYYPTWEAKVFKQEVNVLGDKVFALKETLLITGIRDLELLLLVLEEENGKPSDEDQILSLLNIYEGLKLRVKWDLASPEERAKMAELKGRIRKLGEKISVKEERAERRD